MRTTRITMTPVPHSVWGKCRVSVEVLQENQVPGYLHDTLAAHELTSVIFNQADGTRVEYMAWEYGCEWCGSYDGHGIESCPHFADDDDIEEPMIGG